MNAGGGVAEGIYIAAALVAIITALLAVARWGFKRFVDDIIARIGTPPGADIATMNVSQLELLAQLVKGQRAQDLRLDAHDDRFEVIEATQQTHGFRLDKIERQLDA